ncbi:MAG: hypothetical protein KIT17_07300 [Rubrivivax sp.]|nr:hypothetical protein [Rubrivivax sp.]
MSTLASAKVHEAASLAAMWPFVAGGRAALGLLERDDDASRSSLVFGLLEPGRLQVVRRIDHDDVGIRSADAAVFGEEMVFVLEINQGAPLQLVRAGLQALLDRGAPPPGFTGGHELRLSSPQAASVKMPPADQWNVADTLAPARWLFNPRLVRGQPEPLVVANAADGQLFVLAAAPSPPSALPTPVPQPTLPMPPAQPAPGSLPPLADAAEPQALRADGRLHVAFLRGPKAYRPYWELARYDGRPAEGPRRLFAAGEAAPPQDLSAAFGLGPVAGFALAGGSRGEPWLFALHTLPAGPEIAALTLGAQGWSRTAALSLQGATGAGTHFGALRAGDAWHFFWAEGGPESSMVRHARWVHP